VKFKIGDVIRNNPSEYPIYREVIGILPGEYTVSYLSNNIPSTVFAKAYVQNLSFGYVDNNYVLDTEHKRITEFSRDIKDLLSEV